MKITRRQLRSIIKEEKQKILNEQFGDGSEEKYILDRLEGASEGIKGVASLLDAYADQFGSYEFAEDDPSSEEKSMLENLDAISASIEKFKSSLESYLRGYPSDSM